MFTSPLGYPNFTQQHEPQQQQQQQQQQQPISISSSPSNPGMSSGSHHGQYPPMAPAPGPALTMYSYATPPPQYLLPTSQLYPPLSQSQHHQNQILLAPALASSIATGWGGSSTVPRMGYFPGNRNGMLSPSTPRFKDNGHNTPFGVLTPGSTLPHSTATRLGIVVPSSTIANNLPHEHRTPEYNMYPSSAGGGAVSPSMSAAPLLIWSGGGGGSGPGTASNGGSVPVTLTTDDTAPFEYHHFASAAAGGSNHSFPRVGRLGSIGYVDGADEEEDNDEEDEEDRITPSPPCLGGAGGPNWNPQRGVGVARTPRKRRSTTIAAVPNTAAAARGNARSQGRTTVNGSGATSSGLVPSSRLGGASLDTSPVDIDVPMSSSSASASGPPVNTSDNANGFANPGGVDGQANSPLARKELSPAHRPMIDLYLNQYLNDLCENREFPLRSHHTSHTISHPAPPVQHMPRLTRAIQSNKYTLGGRRSTTRNSMTVGP
jgi:hypothetical protein